MIGIIIPNEVDGTPKNKGYTHSANRFLRKTPIGSSALESWSSNEPLIIKNRGTPIVTMAKDTFTLDHRVINWVPLNWVCPNFRLQHDKQ